MSSNLDNKNWHLIDVSSHNLGRIATIVAKKLTGKEKVSYKPNIDGGDYVVVINSDKVKLSGNKKNSKRYYKHSGYLGSTKIKEYKELFETDSTLIVKEAVRGMLPKNKMLKNRMSRLKVYKGDKHPHQNIKFVTNHG